MVEKKRTFELDLETVHRLELKPRQGRKIPGDANLAGPLQGLPLRQENSLSREVIERLIAWLKES